MRIYLLLNGPEGSQFGIEDGFKEMELKGELTEVRWFYYNLQNKD